MVFFLVFLSYSLTSHSSSRKVSLNSIAKACTGSTSPVYASHRMGGWPLCSWQCLGWRVDGGGPVLACTPIELWTHFLTDRQIRAKIVSRIDQYYRLSCTPFTVPLFECGWYRLGRWSRAYVVKRVRRVPHVQHVRQGRVQGGPAGAPTPLHMLEFPKRK